MSSHDLTHLVFETLDISKKDTTGIFCHLRLHIFPFKSSTNQEFSLIQLLGLFARLSNHSDAEHPPSVS